MIQEISSFRYNNSKIISQCQKLLDEEEWLDSAMKAKYKNNWTRIPSSICNQMFKKQLSDYQEKA